MPMKTTKAAAKTAPSKALPAAALNGGNAAVYTGVSRAHFYAAIRPYIPFVDVSRPGSQIPVLRWRVSDLDAYLASRVRGGSSVTHVNLAVPARQ